MKTKLSFPSILMALVALAGLLPALEAGTPPVQFLYVPIPEDQLLAALQAIEAGGSGSTPTSPIETYISIAAVGAGTIVYYDHWEDGYEANIASPTQATTQIWGDGNPANGAPPLIPGDLINGGTVIILKNSVNTGNLGAIDFDGRDKIGATKTVAMTRTGWASGSETLLAGSVEVFDTGHWGKDYRVPVGEDIPDTSDNQLFQYTGLTIMAREAGTSVQIDANADGTFAPAFTLTEGQSHLVNGGVYAGARIISSKPVQVDLITGDRRSSYESRDSALLPVNLWSDSYYTPVSTRNNDATLVWLYNPGTSAITVKYDYRSGGSPVTGTVSVPGSAVAGGYEKVELPNNTAVHFYTSGGQVFYAFSTTDADGDSSDNQSWDWGFTLIPESSLTPQVIIGLGIGQDPTLPLSENGNPVWITPVGNGETADTIYIDYNGDGLGPNTDLYGNKYDATVSLKELERATVYDPDGDQTGMLLYTLNPKVKLAAAWGQDPNVASVATPGLDVGTSVPPTALFDAGKDATLVVDVERDGCPGPGDTLEYDIRIKSISRAPISVLVVMDTLPADTTYVANSSYYKPILPSGARVAIADGSTTPFPLDEGGYTLPAPLPPGGEMQVVFRALIDTELDLGRTDILNEGAVEGDGWIRLIEDTTPLCPPAPSVEIIKLTNGEDANSPTGPVVLVGAPVVWTYRVKNTGNVPLPKVEVTDNRGVVPVYDSGDDGDGVLEPGEVWLYSATGTAAAGQYANVGTVTGETQGGRRVTDDDPSHYFGANPSVRVVKKTNGDDANTITGPIVEVGSTVTWTYDVTNTGNVVLSNVEVTDDNGTPADPSDDVTVATGVTLAAGETQSFTLTGSAFPGQYANLATVTGQPPIGPEVSDTDPSHYFGADPSVTIKKYTNTVDADDPTGPIVPVGSAVTWTYVVTNTGNMPLTAVQVIDDNGTPANSSDDFVVATGVTLAVGETRSFTHIGMATEGQYGNVATVTGQSEPGLKVGDSDPSHYFGGRPAIDIEKLTNGIDADSPTGPTVLVGSTVTWTYVVTNTGNVTLTSVTVVDDNGTFGNTADDVVVASGVTLAPGATRTFTHTGIAGEGQYANVGTATGTPPPGLGRPVVDLDPSHYFGARPAIDIEKATNGEDADTPTGPLVPVGSAVTWSYVVTNTGNVPLTNVMVIDDNGTPGNTGDDFMVVTGVSLPVGASQTFTRPGVAVAGQYGNVGTAIGTPPVGDPVTESDPSHYFGARPVIDIEKATNGEDADTPTGPLVLVGSTVTWTYEVTNRGNVALSNVTVTDSVPGVAPAYVSGDDGDNVLEPNETWVYRATGTAVAGQYGNVGTATGTPPVGNPVTDTDPSHYFGARPAIDIEKATNGDDADTPTGPLVPVGSTVTWSYQVTNTGNVDLSNVTATDSVAGVTPVYVSGGDGDNLLEPGETWLYQATGVAVAGQYANLGTATGTPPVGRPVRDTDPSHYFGTRPAIDIEKATNGIDADTPTGPLVLVGSTVTWTYRVTNTGNVTLTNVTVVDDNGTPGVPGDDVVVATGVTLAPGATQTFTRTGVAVEGQYGNIGSVTGTPPPGVEGPVEDLDPSHYFGARPAIDIEKLTNGEDADTPTGPTVLVGSTVTWTYRVRNAGNVALTGVTVTDSRGVMPVYVSGDDGDGLLEPGETWVYQATGTAAAGQYRNDGTATGQPPVGPPVRDTDPSHYFGARPGIEIEKLTNGEDADVPPGPWVLVGSTVTWTYRVRNTGNVALSGVTVTDSRGVIPVYVSGDDGDNLLEPGETWVYQATGTAVAGQYSNEGTAKGQPPIGPPVTDTDPSHYFGANPSLVIEKLTNGEDADLPPGPTVTVGSAVTWTYRVTNTGNVPLSGVAVTDNRGVIPVYASGDDGDGLLEPGETWVYEATGTAVAGQYTNIGTATGRPPVGPPVRDEDPSNYNGVPFDFGDAPDPTYPTLLVSNGARHQIVRTLRLGALEDPERDGQPTTDAIGDDLTQLDDEDGVDPLQLVLPQGVAAAIVVRVHNSTGVPATVTGWIDFDRDGFWAASERAAAVAAPGATSVVLRFPVVPDGGAAGCLNDQVLYVLDAGRRLLRYDLGSRGVSVCATGFIGAFDLAADEVGNIYVADFGGATIYKIPAGCGPKIVLTKFARGGPATPWAIAYHGAYLYVTDRSANRILEIDPVTGQRATYISGVVDPVALSFDQAGNLYVATHNGAYLAKYGPGGVLITDRWIDPALGYVDISDVLVERGGYQTYARFRISTDTASVGAPTGSAPDGEVEDYVVTVLPTSFLVFFSGNDANIVYACNAAGQCAEVADFWTDWIQNPFGLAQDCLGRLFVASSGSAAIYVVDPATGASRLWDDFRGSLSPMAGPYGLLVVDEP